MSVEIGKKVANFECGATSDQIIKLSSLKGNNVVIYFYPKDSTSGCTVEGNDFNHQLKHFKKANTVVFGVSRDNLKSHERFKEKEAFNFELISDPDEKLCALFDVMKEKSMYGKKYIGIERSTFLIDATGTLRSEWRKVKVKGHVEEVLAAAKAL